MLSNRQSDLVESTLRELLNRNRLAKATPKTVLAFLFYHMNGMEEGLRGLKVLHENNMRVRICADPQIFAHYHVADLAERMGFNDWISLKELDVQKEQIDHFYIPILPFSVVANLLNFNDACSPIRILLWALMRGKKVSALTAGADPYHKVWRESDLNHGTALLKHEMKKRLQQLRGFGIHLIQNDDDVLNHFMTAFQRETNQVITAEILKKQVEAGRKYISIEQGTIITPLARDVARKYQMKISE